MKKGLLLGLMLSSMVFGLEIDTEKSVFEWAGTKAVGSGHGGKIFLASSDVKVKDGTIVGGTFVMDMKTFTVEDLEGEWEQKFLGHMKSADFFEVETYPTSTLVLNELSNGKAKGELTIKGNTHPVQFDVKKSGQTYEGTLKFDRTKFDMIYGSDNFFKNLGDKVINDEVTLEFKVVLK